MTTITTILTQGTRLYRWRLALPSAWSMFGLSAQRSAAAAQREAAKEVIAVRALAHCHRNSDPGFSSDLYAAADRFERERPDPV